MKKLTEALKATKNWKATGLDEINAELWKYGGTLLHLRLHLFNTSWKKCTVLKDWLRSKVITIFLKTYILNINIKLPAHKSVRFGIQNICQNIEQHN